MDNHGKDNYAHVTFYDDATQLSFVYDGMHGTQVAVSHGGYGEPVIDVFWLRPELENTEAFMFLAHFEGECRKYIAGNDWPRTWLEWDAQRIGGIMILDPDGFDRWAKDCMTRLYDRDEFLKRRDFCTVMFR